MPEGDTVYRLAKALRPVLVGSDLTGCDVRVPRYAEVDLTGERIESVESVGKHLLMEVGPALIHSHLKMEGTWHAYRRGERWRRPAHEARIVLDTADRQAVGFALGMLEILPSDARAEAVGHLGPDLLGPSWDPREAERRLVAQGERAIGLSILDQRVMAGLGNVYRSELCFLKGVLPTTPTSAAGTPASWVDLSHRTIVANKDRSERVFTGDTRKGRQKWVYGRGGKPCLRCDTTIRRGGLGDPVEPGQSAQDRIVYWCPHCQG